MLDRCSGGCSIRDNRSGNVAGLHPAKEEPPIDQAALTAACRDIVAKIKNAKRPVIMPGSGIHLAGALKQFETVVAKLGIPVVQAWTAPDVTPWEDPHYCGRASSIGDRAGNFTVQNAELLLVLGFATQHPPDQLQLEGLRKNAYKIQVDVDPAELDKPTVKPDMPVVANLRDFLPELTRQLDAAKFDSRAHADWLAWCAQTRRSLSRRNRETARRSSHRLV